MGIDDFHGILVAHVMAHLRRIEGDEEQQLIDMLGSIASLLVLVLACAANGDEESIKFYLAQVHDYLETETRARTKVIMHLPVKGNSPEPITVNGAA